MFALQKNDKFSFVAVQNCAFAPKTELQLSDGTHVLTKVPGDISVNWKKWIGETRTEALQESNLVILRRMQSATPQNLDDEHTKLMQQVTDTFWLLQLSGVLKCESASSLQGSVESDGYYTVRQMIQLRPFYPAGEPQIEHVTKHRLEEAVNARAVRDQFRASGAHERFRRGVIILLEGLQSKAGSERMHQSIRAIEALILPPKGETKKKFVHRSRLFAKHATNLENLLGRWFDMRSDVEHVHPVDKSMQDIPASKREATAMRWTRQATTLACFSYRCIFREPTLHPIFETDAALEAFWKQDEATRKKAWPWELNVASVP